MVLDYQCVTEVAVCVVPTAGIRSGQMTVKFRWWSRKQFMKHLQRADVDGGLGMEL